LWSFRFDIDLSLVARGQITSAEPGGTDEEALHSLVKLDDCADSGAVEGPTDRVSRFGPPFGVRVERNRNEDPTSASVGDGDHEPPPPVASIVVTRIHVVPR
jgi:hypothetical protein